MPQNKQELEISHVITRTEHLTYLFFILLRTILCNSYEKTTKHHVTFEYALTVK